MGKILIALLPDRTLLYPAEKIYASRDLIKKYQDGTLDSSEVSNKDLWEAKRSMCSFFCQKVPDMGNAVILYVK